MSVYLVSAEQCRCYSECGFIVLGKVFSAADSRALGRDVAGAVVALYGLQAANRKERSG